MPIDVQQLKSSQIFDDCQFSLNLLEAVPDGDRQLFCVYWTFCVVSLCRVKDALEKYDIVMHQKMREQYKSSKNELFLAQGVLSQGYPVHGMFFGLSDLPSSDSRRTEHRGP